jgi:Fur family ferric uptake transcriptional regulator
LERIEVESFQRQTRQRRAILEELQNLSTHPTAVELYEITRRRLPRISLGTVYRNLDLLVRAGIVQRLQGVGAETRFEGKPDRHSHVRCVRCGRLDDVHEARVNLVGRKANRLKDYEILGHKLELFGICSECRGLGTLKRSGGRSPAERIEELRGGVG